jgi:hypothetical protein
MRLDLAAVALTISSVLIQPLAAGDGKKSDYRSSVIARAQVWRDRDPSSVDFTVPPGGAKGFATDATINCEYLKRKLHGNTPKFDCRTDGGEELKVKFGGDNGEVYAEVIATRLLLGLGFGADSMYSVRVICKGCPASYNGTVHSPTESLFDPATVEHKFHGESFQPDDSWSWAELDLVDEESGGASRAERDALKLLAVFMQHSDSKPEQQRLVCLDEEKGEGKNAAKRKQQMPCAKPFMLINDLGVTFGRANRFNENKIGSMNLVEWSKTPVWKEGEACVGNLPKSQTGTLDNPSISEEGRRFLADRLTQLSDGQLHDLFESGRVNLRLSNPADVFSGFATVDQWVNVFKQKRDEIVSRHCTTS